MTPERWQQVKEVLQQVLQLEPKGRGAFLDRICSSDASLRAEIESLLSADEQIVSSFLECPPFAGPMIGVGTRLGDYEVLSLLGSGGMGEVYRAHDCRLGRDVAIKVLPAVLSQEPDRLRRFDKEARAAAALSHPNIMAVYHLGAYKGSPYLVSELLQGETLRKRLTGGALPVPQAIDYGVQIALGLAAAHEQGTVHRDLKPENLFVTRNGCIKILDFGLVKLTFPLGQMPGDTATLNAVTNPGSVMGTPGYMSPEQVTGTALDARTDLFSLGVVLYEMATGARPFHGATYGAICHSILSETPVRPAQLNRELPPEMDKIIVKSLEKDRELRYQSASELLTDLQRVHREAGFHMANNTDASLAMDVRPALPPRSAISTSRAKWKFVLVLAAVAVAMAITASLWLQKKEYFWRNPIADAQFQTVTDFGGAEQAAAVSRDGHFVSFLSDRDGQMDVWITQVGSGQFHNLTRGSAPGLANPLLRTLGFSPDGSLVTFWIRKQNGSSGNDISVWAVPTLGGQPRPYLEGVAEFDWSRDGSQLVYHLPGPGDPMFVSDDSLRSGARPIFTAPTGLHAHFPVWAPDSAFIYFVQGSIPDKLDIWRIRPTGETPERITSQNGRVTYPVLLDRRTLLYLASDSDASGPWLYSMDVERRIPHRVSSGPDRYTSLAVSADGRRLVATLASPKRTLWRLRIADSPTEVSAAAPISLTTSTGFSPRLGPGYLLYVSATGTSESIWKLTNGIATELWSGQGVRIFGGPAISHDGRHIAFSVRQNGRTLLYVMKADGTSAKVVSDSLDLQGAPAWAPDSLSITSAANDHGVPHLFCIPVEGSSPTVLVQEYSVDPVWSPDGRFVVYSGPDVGTTFPVKAVTAQGAKHPLPPLILTRGARHLVFLPRGRALLLLRGDIKHKNLWLIDLETGAERQLTNLTPDFDIRDFDVSPDGHEVVLERVQERSEVVLLDLPRK